MRLHNFCPITLQATYAADLPCETVSKINLVDLAGRSVSHLRIMKVDISLATSN